MQDGGGAVVLACWSGGDEASSEIGWGMVAEHGDSLPLYLAYGRIDVTSGEPTEDKVGAGRMRQACRMPLTVRVDFDSGSRFAVP